MTKFKTIQYEPYFAQSAHRDGICHLSVVLTGALAEGQRDRTVKATAGSVCFKGRDALHETHFSEDGAHFLWIMIDRNDLGEGAPALHLNEWHDELAYVRFGAALVRAIANHDAASVRATTVDMLTLLGSPTRKNSTPPSWLIRMHECAQQGDLATAMKEATDEGVPHYTASRLFRSTYGCSLSEAVRAVRARSIAQQLPDRAATLAKLSTAQGFFDQSHMTRTFASVFGQSPGKWRSTVQHLASNAVEPGRRH